MGRYQNLLGEGGLYAGKRAAYFKPAPKINLIHTLNLEITLAN